MGGYGSGWHRGARQTVEDALTYTTAGLRPFLRVAEQAQANGQLGAVTTGTCTWSRGGRQTDRVGFSLCVERILEPLPDVGTCGIVLVLNYTLGGKTLVSVRVPLDTSPVHRTGRRYWMRCPACSRRCGVLHLPGGALRFACRTCHDLTYTSCQESGKFDAMFRALGAQMGTDPATVKRLLRRGGYG